MSMIEATALAELVKLSPVLILKQSDEINILHESDLSTESYPGHDKRTKSMIRTGRECRDAMRNVRRARIGDRIAPIIGGGLTGPAGVIGAAAAVPAQQAA